MTRAMKIPSLLCLAALSPSCDYFPPTAPPGNYDLAVSAFSHTPTEVTEGDPVSFTYKIVNKGSSTIPRKTYEVDLYVDGTRVSWDHATHDFAPGDTGATYSMSAGHHHWKPLKPGTYSYRLVLDERNRLKETDETNNILSGTIEVKPKAAAQPAN